MPRETIDKGRNVLSHDLWTVSGHIGQGIIVNVTLYPRVVSYRGQNRQGVEKSKKKRSGTHWSGTDGIVFRSCMVVC